MKAEELIKALECCTLAATACKECHYREKGCLSSLHKDTLRYIQLLKQDKAAAETKARKAGVNVLSEQAAPRSPKNPYF